MERKYLKKMVWLGLLFALLMAGTANASVNINGKAKTVIPWGSTTTYIADLNGDGTNETITFQLMQMRSSSGELIKGNVLFVKDVNGNTAHQVIALSRTGFAGIIDLNKNDDYMEIFCVIKESSTRVSLVKMFRYNGKEFIPIVDFSIGTARYAKVAQNKHLGEVLDISVPGNGKLTIKTSIYSSKSRQNKISVDLRYKVSNKKMVLDTSGTYKTNKSQKTLKAATKMYVYKKNSMTGNTLIKTIKKGGKYKPLQIKFGKDITAMQVKVGKKKGWVFLKTKALYY